MSQLIDDRDDAFSDTETQEKFGDGYEAFRKSAVNDGRRSTVLGARDSKTRSGPDSTTRSGPDPFNGHACHKEVDEDENSYTYREQRNSPPRHSSFQEFL